MKLLIHGSGFPRPYRSDPEELRCGKPTEVRGNPTCAWSPSSIDWEALGQKSGGSTPAGTVDALVAAIQAQRVESIEELRIVGHSNGSFLALGGKIDPREVVFTENTMLGSSQTTGIAPPHSFVLSARLQSKPLRDHDAPEVSRSRTSLRATATIAQVSGIWHQRPCGQPFFHSGLRRVRNQLAWQDPETHLSAERVASRSGTTWQLFQGLRGKDDGRTRRLWRLPCARDAGRR
jgi:hypothetical protein